MERSISYLNNALEVLYIDFECIKNDCYDWDCFKETLVETLQSVCPNFCELKAKVMDGEVLIVTENCYSQVGVNRYCGIVSVSIRVHNDYRTNENLATTWIKQIWPKIEDVIDKKYKVLKKIGELSNGAKIF